ncbi:peptidylprolyl isomerase [Nautilia sp. PV-1]|uniref:FKBP-type peptidyl-prolyl cis-trans isomerase n=1 Tax=Nautilia sp. PV-1 TaxID=2579250 RepID=UPI000FD92D98|nr:peptidylprolyl isomerase [Nautilia sp. PV-1]AZV46027.1 peptidylprolyl isomerase [Nautilia sp. PV-1]
MAKVYGIEYTVKNSKGEVVDSNKGQAPLEFIAGQNQIIPGLEKEVEGMEVGEEKTVTVKADEAYGQRNEEWVETLPKEQFEGIDLQKGMTLYGQSPDGQTIAVTVVDFDDKNVTIDYNHPLAGEDLTFDVKVVSKRDATLEELAGGEQGQGCGCGTGCGCH